MQLIRPATQRGKPQEGKLPSTPTGRSKGAVSEVVGTTCMDRRCAA
jgi:hypothetical protein